MINDDVKLIRKILSGDDDAFSKLVQKYQKSVHAFAWREIGDYHFAEEITQETFIQVYKNLATLRNPKLFGGWLHVIAKRICIKWNQKRKSKIQLLEDTPIAEIDECSYSKYVSEQQETQATESRLERVKNLLEKLPESERTVVTLYYLGEMTTSEISKFLGVSVNTIKSRLRRARMRLQEETAQPQEILSTVKFSTNLTESIMRQIADIKQTPTPIGNPSLPWAAFGCAAILVIAIIGLSNQQLLRFQEPYSLDAQSEPKIELVDASTLFDTDIKLAAQNQPKRLGAIEITQDGTTTETKKKTPVNLGLEAILAGIKQNDEAVKSGEGRTVFTYEDFKISGAPMESITWKARLIFDEHQNRVRMELADNVTLLGNHFPRRTIITTEKGTLHIEYPRIDHKPRYSFEKITRLRAIWKFVAPRRWTRITDTEDLATTLKELNYRILTREMLDGISCYVLEGKKEPPPEVEQQKLEISRIWIAPEHGFRIQKLETRWTSKEEFLDGKVKEGAPYLSRHTFSYQQIGDVWFLKSAKLESAQIVSKGKERITSRITLELQDFKINHAVPPETFIFDIPDDAKIKVEGLDERISKQEFFEQYGQK